MSLGTPGATEIIADAPLPRDAAEAAAMRESLTSDAEWMKDWKTDQGKQSTLGYLRWVANNNSPDDWGKPAATAEQVRAQMLDRDLALDDARVETWGKFISDWDDQKRRTIARDLCTQQEHDEALRDKARFIGDLEFGRRVLNGDTATLYSWRGLQLSAGDIWARVNRTAAMQVAPDDHDWSK